MGGNGIVPCPRSVTCPAIKSPIGQCYRRTPPGRASGYKDWAAVPNPRPVGPNHMKLNLREVRANMNQASFSLSPTRLILNNQRNALTLRQLLDDLGKTPAHSRCLNLPIRSIVRPYNPGRAMRFPFSRHSKSTSSRRNSGFSKVHYRFWHGFYFADLKGAEFSSSRKRLPISA